MVRAMSITSLSPLDPEEQRAPTGRPIPRVILTRDGEREIRAELERLREEAGGDLVERLREAREAGAASENDEYLQIQEEEAVLASRIHRLEGLLAFARIVDEGGAAADVAAIGTIVEVKDLRSGDVREHRLTGGFGLNADGDVSVNSPVGQALLGRSPGDEVSVELPNGKLARFELLAVRPDRAQSRA